MSVSQLVDQSIAAGTPAARFHIGSNLKLLPKFNDKEPGTFFFVFERLADARNWPDQDHTLMLQCVLTGKAQEAYAALTSEVCENDVKLKAAVLKAYVLVQEAYRQHFRNWRKSDRQTC